MAMAKIATTLLGPLTLLVACSEDSLAQAQGAASLHFGASLSPAAETVCPVLDHVVNAPRFFDGVQPLSGSAAGVLATDGIGNDYVKCRVAPELDKYRVTGDMVVTGTDASGFDLRSEFSVQVLIGENDHYIEGLMLAADETTGIAAFASDSCLFSVLPTPDAPALGVAPGHIWARVLCAQIDDVRNFRGDECSITGYFTFDHCAR
jgi:hypothetical protein